MAIKTIFVFQQIFAFNCTSYLMVTIGVVGRIRLENYEVYYDVLLAAQFYFFTKEQRLAAGHRLWTDSSSQLGESSGFVVLRFSSRRHHRSIYGIRAAEVTGGDGTTSSRE